MTSIMMTNIDMMITINLNRTEENIKEKDVKVTVSLVMGSTLICIFHHYSNSLFYVS